MGRPAFRSDRPFLGPWYPEVAAVQNPAAGSGLSVAGDPRYVSELVALAFRIVTDGTVANRTPVVEILDQDGIKLGGFVGPTAATATQTVDVTAFLGGTNDLSLAGDSVTMGLPLGWVLGLYTVQVRIVGIAAGDQISRVRLTWKRHVTAYPGGEVPGPALA